MKLSPSYGMAYFQMALVNFKNGNGEQYYYNDIKK